MEEGSIDAEQGAETLIEESATTIELSQPLAETLAQEGGDVGESCATRIWTSNDPHVGELANAIEQRYPGHVVAVNEFRDGVEIDIETQNAIIEVKSGNLSGIGQQITTRLQFGKPVIGYSPTMTKWGAREINNRGGIAAGGGFSTLEDLLDVLAP